MNREEAVETDLVTAEVIVHPPSVVEVLPLAVELHNVHVDVLFWISS